MKLPCLQERDLQFTHQRTVKQSFASIGRRSGPERQIAAAPGARLGILDNDHVSVQRVAEQPGPGGGIGFGWRSFPRPEGRLPNSDCRLLFALIVAVDFALQLFQLTFSIVISRKQGLQPLDGRPPFWRSRFAYRVLVTKHTHFLNSLFDRDSV